MQYRPWTCHPQTPDHKARATMPGCQFLFLCDVCEYMCRYMPSMWMQRRTSATLLYSPPPLDRLLAESGVCSLYRQVNVVTQPAHKGFLCGYWDLNMSSAACVSAHTLLSHTNLKPAFNKLMLEIRNKFNKLMLEKEWLKYHQSNFLGQIWKAG